MVKDILKTTTKRAKRYQLEVISQMLKLATNGFGLVAALAWNNVIKEFVAEYIKPFVGTDSGMVSLIIYAIVVTLLAVTITLQLSKIKDKLASLQEEKEKA